MAYEKQNFKNGEILPADKLNHIEDGIVDLENSQEKIDDLNITTDKAWSSRRIIDTLCPPLEETGNPVTCYPVTGYSLDVKVSWEPTQEGSGTPYPAGGGPNLLDISQCTATVGKPYGVTITIDGDVFKVSGVPSSEVTEEGQYSFAVASCTQTELRGKGYKITPFALKGDVSSAWGLRTEDEDSLAIAAKLIPSVNTDIQLRLMVSKDTPAAYAPYENICPIKGRDSVTVERCGENLLNITPFTKAINKGITYEYVANGGVHISGTALANAVSPTFSVWNLPPGKYYGLDSGEGIGSSIVVQRNGRNVWLGTKRTFAILAGDVIKFWCLSVNDGITVDKTLYPYIVPGTTAPTTYAPYTGQTATLTLPRTIYGGTVDAVTGEGQETWKVIAIDAKKIKFSSSDNDRFWNLPYHTADGATGASKIICSHFISSKFSVNEPYAFFFTQPDRLQNLFSSVDELNDYCAAQYAAGTPVQIVYQSLKEPVSFTATGAQPISALSGVNTVLTDADTLTVTGRAMPEKNRNQNLSTDILFKYPRTGKVYTVKIPKFTSNPTTVCEKLDDNTGLVCEASTDTIEGRDDYAEIPLFKWYNCNYKRDENGHAYPIAIEGFDDNYTTSGNIDVGVIQMTPFVKWDDSNDDYIILSITDNPTEGYRAWSTARVGGEVYPYVIHSKYISSLGTDGLLHSVPNAKPERNQSYNNMITNYAKKGSGYKGAGVERNTWQIIFTLIKYANKSSQNIFAGTTGYSFQYSASIQSAEKHTYFPVTNAQAANIIIGGYVSVGYAYKTSDTATSLDRGYDTVHSYADSVKVLKIEDLDDSNKAVYLDVKEGFDTIQHEYSDTLSAPITLTSIHWYSGSTDSIMGHHDGSFVNNNNSKYPYRVQGVEYAVGGYTVASDTVIVFTDNNEKDVYVSPSNIAHSSDDATIKSNYKNVGHIPSGELWIGDIGFDTDMNATWPTVRGSGNATGVGDYNYGSIGNNGITREYLQGGGLWHGSDAGSSCLSCWGGLGRAAWFFLSAD